MARLLALSLLLATLPALAEGRRVAVVPFVALTGDVPPRAGAKAAGMLATELGNAGGLTPVAPEAPEGSAPAADALARARAAVTEAKGLFEARRPGPADAALGRALADYAQGAAQLSGVDEVADAWALRAAVQYARGQDAAAEASLGRALALAPGRPLPLAATSPLFAREVERVRQALEAGPRGHLVVESLPAGAGVEVDGVDYGPAPVRVAEVRPGTHLWRVRLPGGDGRGGEWVGGAVEVAGGKEARVQAEAGGAGPAGRLSARLARNRLDAELLAAAREHAAASQADTLLFGALRREGAGLALELLLFQAASGELRRLPRAAFDADLLSAGQQFLTLATALARGGALGEPVKVPAPVTAAALPTPARAERAFVVRGDGTPGERASGKDGPVAPAEAPRQPVKRAPLRRP